jgi:hypothetical protein
MQKYVSGTRDIVPSRPHTTTPPSIQIPFQNQFDPLIVLTVQDSQAGKVTGDTIQTVSGM